MSQPPSAGGVRFGVFEADLTSGELLKRGRKVPLQEQPWQVLFALLEKPGALVTREQLQKRLWPDGTFVDFELSLNKAVNRLREALSEWADNPRFIETLPRKGCRFIAPMEAMPPAVQPETAEPTLPVTSTTVPQSLRKRRRWFWSVGLAAIVALILVTGLWSPSEPVTKVTPLTSDARVKRQLLAVSGGRVLYTATGLGKDAEKGELWSVPAAGGDAREERTPCAQSGVGMLLLGVNYLRQRLLLYCVAIPWEGDLWLTGFDGSSPRSIGHIDSHDIAVSISPDLATLLFSRTDGLFAGPVGGGAERQLVRPDVWNAPSYTFWHPAGGRIGFIRNVGGLPKIWEVRTDGAGLRPLVPEFAGEQDDAHWSPDGQRLYFVSKGEIYLQRSRGWLGWMRRPAPVRLTSGPIQFGLPNEDPANRLVIYANGWIEQATAMKLDRKTNAWEPFLGGLAADCFNYSPDGQWIAYVSWPKAELWKCRKDGSAKQLLEDDLFTCNPPRWSPDGSRIAFSARTRIEAGIPPPFHIYAISANGGRPEPVPGLPGPAFDPSWSPDGRRLAFAPYFKDVPKEQQHVSIVDLKTGAVEAVPGSDGLYAPRWSPEGKWLAALSADKQWPYVYSFATQKWAVLHPSYKGFHEWSRDSRYLRFVQWVPEKSIVRIEVATGRMEEVRKLSEFDITGVFGSGAFWTPDDEPVVLKNLSSDQIYRIERDR